MKYWQLALIIRDETEIYVRFLSGVDLLECGRNVVSDDIVLDALKLSSKRCFVTSHRYLRLMPEAEYLIEQGIRKVEEFSIFTAYQKFGADAIAEVLDYGSFNIEGLNNAKT